MMCQTAPQGEPHFVNTMLEHTAMCGQMARAFGNDRFESPAPFPEVLYTVENHDRGWDTYDRNPAIDPDTRLPYIMVKTPIPDLVKTNRGSPDFNEAHHPYCGLLSSMHTVGLYNGRYGFSKFIARTQTTTSIDVADTQRAMIDAMLANENTRQTHLKSDLRERPATRDWIADPHLFQNYKQLQFFDTMSLYFHLRHANDRGVQEYVHVPLNAEEDTTITLKKVDDRTYSLDPWPFADDRLEITCRGRYAKEFPTDFPADRVGAALRDLAADQQTYVLVPA
jgi:Protein of unknown function (DUF3891)